MDYENKNREAIRAIKQALRQLATNGVPVGNVIDAMKDMEEKYAEFEDEKIRKKLIEAVKGDMVVGGTKDKQLALSWLKKQGEQNLANSAKTCKDEQKSVNIDYISGIQKELLGIEDNAKNIVGLTESQWVAIRAAHRLLGEYMAKEQKPADNVEPKFHIGDRVRYKGHACDGVIIEITDTDYICGNTKLPISTQDKLELVEQKSVEMIQWKGNNLKEVIDFTGKSPKFGEWFKTWDEYEKYVHEHNNIFKIFNKDGSYIEVPVGAWIVKTPDGYNTASRYVFRQNPAWSEEDEDMRCKATAVINRLCAEGKDYVWSINTLNKLFHWFKSLKDRVQPKVEWSEGDKAMLVNLVAWIEGKWGTLGGKVGGKEAYISFLKSIQERYTWKPSEKHIKALDNILKHFRMLNATGETIDNLKELKEQLKKLMEE